MRILQVHGRFVLVVVICLTLMLVAHKSIVPVSDSAKKAVESAETTVKSMLASAVADYERSGSTANIEIGARRTWHGLLETLVAAQAAALSYQELEDFRIPPELAGDLTQRENQYAEILRRVENRIGYARYWRPKRLKADATGKTDVEYDFGNVTGPSAFPITARLTRLDVLSRAALAAAATRVNQVTAFRFREVKLSDIQGRLPSVMPAETRPDVPLPRPMLGRVEIEIEVVGNPEAIYRFMALLQQSELDGVSGRTLTFETFRVAKEDWRNSGDDFVTLSGVLVATRVTPGTELPNESKQRAVARIPEEAQLAKRRGGTTSPGTEPPKSGEDDGFHTAPPPVTPGSGRPRGGGR